MIDIPGLHCLRNRKSDILSRFLSFQRDINYDIATIYSFSTAHDYVKEVMQITHYQMKQQHTSGIKAKTMKESDTGNCLG